MEHHVTNNLGAQAAQLLDATALEHSTYRNHFHAAPAAAAVVPRFQDRPPFAAGIDSGINHPGTISGLHSHTHAGDDYNQWVVDDANHQAARHTYASVSGKTTSVYAHEGGIKAFAANGPVSLQAHTSGMQIRADQDLTIYSINDEVDIEAKSRIELFDGQSSVVLEGGDITLLMPGLYSAPMTTHEFMPAGGHPNTAGEIIGGLISLIPVLDQVMDVRDIAACLYRINHQGGFKNATPDQIVNLGFAAIGAIPEVGSVFKTVFKPLWRERHLAKTAVHSGTQAIETMLGMKKGGAIDWIRKELLGKWGPRTQQAIAQVNMAMDSCIALLDFVATASGWKGYLIPDGIQAMASAALPGMKGMRSGVNATMQQATAEIGMFLQDLLGEQAAKVVMEAGKRAVPASAIPGARSNSHNRHNAAAAHPKGKELPRQGRETTGGRDKAKTDKGAGGTHAASQLTRQAFGKMAHVATGLIGEHMVDYFELKRLGGSFTHDSSKRFPNNASVAKINADKRPVNLSLTDLPKVPHKGIDAVWQHGDRYTVTEAKARGSIFMVENMLNKMKMPAGITSHDDKLLYFLLSTSKSEEGDGKPLVQMSRAWVLNRAEGEDISSQAKRALKADVSDRRVVLVTFESSGAMDHAQALAEIKLDCDPSIASEHTEHGIHQVWKKTAIDNVAEHKAMAKSDKAKGAPTPKSGSKAKK